MFLVPSQITSYIPGFWEIYYVHNEFIQLSRNHHCATSNIDFLGSSSLYTHLKNAKLVGTISWKSSLFFLLPLLHNYQIVFVMIKKSCWSSIAIWIVGFYQKLSQIPILRKKAISYIWGWIWWLILFVIHIYEFLYYIYAYYTKKPKWI